MRPTSNRDYKVKNKETGEWELIKATPTQREVPKIYTYRAKYKRKGYEQSVEERSKKQKK
jgi:hypothetical protein